MAWQHDVVLPLMESRVSPETENDTELLSVILFIIQSSVRDILTHCT